MKLVIEQHWWDKFAAYWEMNRFLRLCGIRELEALDDSNRSLKEEVRVLYLSLCLGFGSLLIPIYKDMNRKWTNEEIIACTEETSEREQWLSDFYAEQQSRPRVRRIIEKRLEKYQSIRKNN